MNSCHLVSVWNASTQRTLDSIILDRVVGLLILKMAWVASRQHGKKEGQNPLALLKGVSSVVLVQSTTACVCV